MSSSGGESVVLPARGRDNDAPITPSQVTPNSDGTAIATCSSGYKSCVVGMPDNMQMLCYNAEVFKCIPHAAVNNVICPVQSTGVCGLNCFNAQQMKCVEGVLITL